MLEVIVKDLVKAIVVAAVGAAVTHLLSRNRHENVNRSPGER